MTLTTVFVVCGGLLLFFFLLVRPLLLWATVRTLRARVTFRRCLLTVLVILLAEWLSAILLVVVLPDLGEPEGSRVVSEALEFSLVVALTFIWLRWGLRTKFLKTLSVMVIWTGLSLAVALGVVLGVRWKLLETFQMPSGGMAPTLIGTHLVVPCTSCGLSIQAGIHVSESGEFHPGLDRLVEQTVTCPNYGMSEKCSDAEIGGGDRFLVDKTVEPRRWDPIAFIYPRDVDIIYLKRLVGLPGETIEIFLGDIFANNRRLTKPPMIAEDMWIAVHDTPDLSSSREQSGPLTPNP